MSTLTKCKKKVYYGRLALVAVLQGLHKHTRPLQHVYYQVYTPSHLHM